MKNKLKQAIKGKIEVSKLNKLEKNLYMLNMFATELETLIPEIKGKKNRDLIGQTAYSISDITQRLTNMQTKK